MIKAIVAVGENWEIGKNNDLLFNLKGDMKHFVEYTKGQIVFCGHKTLQSFPNGKPLKNRSTIVLAHEGTECEDCICVHSFDKAVKLIKVLAITQDVWVIGGGTVYKAMLPYCDEVYVTKVVAADPEATVFFPNLDSESDFEVTYTSMPYYEGSYKYQFLTYTRKNKTEGV